MIARAPDAPAMRTVLIFAHECAPYHREQSTVGAQRPAQFAKYLPAFGWRAIVICCDARRRGTPCPDIEREVRDALGASGAGESVIIPTASLPWTGLVDRAWRAVQPRTGRDPAWRKLARRPLTVAKLFSGDYSQAWQPCARAAAEVVARMTRVDACIGEHSPDAGIFLARWFSQRFGVPWVADFRDAMLQPLKPALRFVYRPFARRLLSTASAVVNVTPYWSELDAKLFGRPVVTIPNGFDPAEFDGPVPESNGAFVMCYTGHMWPQMRMEIALAGLAEVRTRRPQLSAAQLRFVYRGAHWNEILESARRYGVADLVDADRHIARPEAVRLMRRADVLLLLSIADVEAQDEYLRRGIYPAKAFEYFGARRPILCVPGDRGLLEALIQDTKTGVVARTPGEVADALEHSIQRRPDSIVSRFNPDDRLVGSFSRRVLTGRLAQVLDGVVRP